MIRHIMIALLVVAAIVISFLFDDPANAGQPAPVPRISAEMASPIT